MQQQPGGAQLLQEYVYRALVSKLKGQDVSLYNNFVREFSSLRKKVDRDPSEEGLLMLANLITALKDCVSVLRERKHDSILTEIMAVKLWDAAPVVRTAVLDLVGNLVVVNSAFTHACLHLLVFSLLPPPSPPKPEAGMGSWQPSEQELAVQSSILAALVKVLALVPTAPGALLQLVSSNMPHKLRDRNTQCLFLHALFCVAEAPAGRPIRDGLLTAVVEHLLTIDVEIRWEDIVDVPTGEEEEEVEGEEAGEEPQEDIFALEGMSELDINAGPEAMERIREARRAAAAAAAAAEAAGTRGGWEGAAAGHHAADPAGADGEGDTAGKPAVDETANKLDSMMELAFAHLARRCEQPGGARMVWDTLLAIFERTILNTHRSKFSQYLVFFMCYKHPEPCATLFVQLLLNRLQDPNQPAITRSACAAYLASFLARAAFVPHHSLVAALVQLTRFCQDYCSSVAMPPRVLSSGNILLSAGSGGLQQLRESCSGADGGSNSPTSLTAKHQVLYASVQAVLYVLCYHLEPLLSHTSKHASGQPSLADTVRNLVVEGVLPLLSHRLQPLSVCLPSVVTEFKNQVTRLRLVDMAMLPKVDELQRAQRPLEMFFPFDPFLLKRSSRFLELKSSYVRWRHGHAQAAAYAHDSDAEDETAADMDGDLELDEESEEDTSSDSSSDSEDESLRGGSLPSESLLRPAAQLLLKRAGAAALPPPSAALPANGRGSGRGARPLPGHVGVVGKYDPMGTSFSPGHGSGMGDLTPTGTSPVVVDYFHGGASISPMQLGTPPLHAAELLQSRLAGKRK